MNTRAPTFALLSALLLSSVPALAQSTDQPVTPNGESAPKGSTGGPVQTITSGTRIARPTPVHRTVRRTTRHRRVVAHNRVSPAAAAPATPAPVDSTMPTTTPTSSTPSR